jgi:hypothetical protein
MRLFQSHESRRMFSIVTSQYQAFIFPAHVDVTIAVRSTTSGLFKFAIPVDLSVAWQRHSRSKLSVKNIISSPYTQGEDVVSSEKSQSQNRITNGLSVAAGSKTHEQWGKARTTEDSQGLWNDPRWDGTSLNKFYLSVIKEYLQKLFTQVNIAFRICY